ARAAYAHEPLRYLSVKGHAVWNYVGLLFGSGNSPDYDLPVLDANPFGVPLALAGWVLFPAAAFVLYRARRRLEFLGVVWVFITLLPALLFPLVTYMAERYLYAPSVGICWAIAAAAVGLTARRGTLAKGAAVAVMVALVSFFTVRTIQYSRVWSGSEALWTYALTKSRDYRVYNNLAQVRMEEKRWDEA